MAAPIQSSRISKTSFPSSLPSSLLQVSPVLADLNALLNDEESGGGSARGHGMVLALHIMKLLKSSRRFTDLLTKKFDAICSGINCLQPVHMQLKARERSSHPFCCHLPYLQFHSLTLFISCRRPLSRVIICFPSCCREERAWLLQHSTSVCLTPW